MTDQSQLSASQLSGAIRERNVSCIDVMQAYLTRIRRLNPVYNAIVSLRAEDDCMAEAERADDELRSGHYRGWMHGMPHAIKDLSNAAGLKTSFGSRIFAGTLAERDDPFVALIRNAGAILIGKTNTPEWGLGGQTYNDVFGVTRNAYDVALTAGGSSGGAACALATRMLPVADGSDMMGSLRTPAAFNNVIGFRPSYGRVPNEAASDPYVLRLSTNGPMGRTVEDTIRLLRTMTGSDSRTPPGTRNALPEFDAFEATTLSGYRLGWMGDFDGYLPMEAGVIDICEAALARVAGKGALVEKCLPEYDFARLWQTWLTLRHWSLHEDRALYQDPEKRALMKPEWRWEIEQSVAISPSRLAEAKVARNDWQCALTKLFDNHDVLVLPSAQVFPFSAGIHWPESIADKRMDTYHRWLEVTIGGTLAGLPVVSLPAGFDASGRPMGLQFMGPMGQDKQVLEFALAYEAVVDYGDILPDLQGE